MKLSSPANRSLKEYRHALRASHPAPDDLIALEGPHLIEEALRSRLPLESLLVSPAGERLLSRLGPLLRTQPALKVLRTTDRLFASLADTQHPQGIAALIRQPSHSLADFLAGTSPLIVVLIGIQDPGNVGAILRSAEAFAASGVIITGAGSLHTAHPFAPKILRASAGSALRLPIVLGPSAPVVLAQLRLAHLKLFATASGRTFHDRDTFPPPEGAPSSPAVRARHGVPQPSPSRGSSPTESFSASLPESSLPESLAPSSADLSVPLALLIGNEGAGLPAEILHSSDALLRIPIAPHVESLNAAVAASLLLYESARQRGLASSA